MKHLHRISRANFGKNSGRLIFGRKNKSMERSRSMKFTYNVDQAMIKIIGEEKFI